MTFSRTTKLHVLLLGVLIAAASFSGLLPAQDVADDKQKPAGDRQEAAGDRQEAAGDRQEAAGDRQEATGDGQEAADDGDEAVDPGVDEKSNLIRLDKESKVWIDLKRKIVVVDGKICLREGQLEMFACPRSTKEHESVVSVESTAKVVHAALIAVGAVEGQPVQFAPEYTPASGTEVDVYVLWVDEKGKRRKARAQEWIRQVRTNKPMPYSWVFAGSGFWVDEETGTKHYMAEDGDLICVSNFATATLDLPIASSQSNDGLMFDALTENIPALGTKVRLVLVPKLKKEGEKGEKKGEDGVEDAAADEPEASASGTTD